MALILGDGLRTNKDSPLDTRTLFATKNEALSSLKYEEVPGRNGVTINTERYIGMKFMVKDDSANDYPGPREYWFKEGVKDEFCIPFEAETSAQVPTVSNWIGTQAEFDAIKDDAPDGVYFVTDD